MVGITGVIVSERERTWCVFGFFAEAKNSKQCVESALDPSPRANQKINLGLIRRHFKFLHKDVVIRLYKQMVRPHLEYAFNDQVRLVRQQILSAKFVFEKSLASNIKENPKAFFSYVRSKQKVKDTVGPLKKSNVSSLVSDNQGMADILNDFFASVFEPDRILTYLVGL